MSINDEKISFELEVVNFPGYYDSVLLDPDVSYELLDDLDDLIYSLGGSSLSQVIKEVDEASGYELSEMLYEYIDREEYSHDMNNDWMEKYLSYVPLRSLEQVGEVEMFSPREYNFSSDRIFAKVEVNRSELQELLEKCLATPRYEEFLKAHFTPSPWFRSNYSCDINMWNNLDEMDDLQKSYLLYFGALEDLGKVKNREWELNSNILEDLDMYLSTSYLKPDFYIEVEKRPWAKGLVASRGWQELRKGAVQATDLAQEVEPVSGKKWSPATESKNQQGRGKGLKP